LVLLLNQNSTQNTHFVYNFVILANSLSNCPFLTAYIRVLGRGRERTVRIPHAQTDPPANHAPEIDYAETSRRNVYDRPPKTLRHNYWGYERESALIDCRDTGLAVAEVNRVLASRVGRGPLSLALAKEAATNDDGHAVTSVRPYRNCGRHAIAIFGKRTANFSQNKLRKPKS